MRIFSKISKNVRRIPKVICSLLVILALFSSCQQMSDDDLRGRWRIDNKSYFDSSIKEIHFAKERISLIDQFAFVETCSYELTNGQLTLVRNSDQFEIRTKIEDFGSDTMTLFDSVRYNLRYADDSLRFSEFSLAGIKTDRLVSELEDSSWQFAPIHYYKDSAGHIKLRASDAFVEFSTFTHFISFSHHQPKLLLFLGSEISLGDLNRLYF